MCVCLLHSTVCSGGHVEILLCAPALAPPTSMVWWESIDGRNYIITGSEVSGCYVCTYTREPSSIVSKGWVKGKLCWECIEQ